MKAVNKIIVGCFLMMVLFSFSSIAQVLQISLGVDGLTCPMCSRGVEKSLMKLSFIERVEMDLENTSAMIFVKREMALSLNEIVKKVHEAGFSTRFLKIQMNMALVNQSSSNCFNYGGLSYTISGSGKVNLTGNLWFRIIDKQFMNSREYKSYEKVIETSVKNCNTQNFRETHHVVVL